MTELSPEYDYCIVGAGPTGLTLAFLFATIGKRCIIIDKNQSIGGCHRVTRVNGLFTEHGPRIYSNSFRNVRALFRKMKLSFKSMFVKYKFDMATIGDYSVEHFDLFELYDLAWEFGKFTINDSSGQDISVAEFADQKKFTLKTKEYLDRLCRLTDGGSSANYSLNKLLQLANQQFLNDIYQPSQPNDIKMFKEWGEVLQKLKVDFLLDTQVVSINGQNSSKVDSISVAPNSYNSYNLSKFQSSRQISAKKFVLCIPPKPLGKLLEQNSLFKHSFGDMTIVQPWIEKNTYQNYIPITFHWHEKDLPPDFKLASVWGFPKSDWGVAFIELTQYMDFKDERSKLVLSTCITKPDAVSKFNHKNPHQCDESELKEEVFRQLKISFPNLPKPSFVILHPTVRRENNEWVEDDTAFIASPNSFFLPFQSNETQNLFQVGTQNGNSMYAFTSMESAVSNAIAFANKIEHETRSLLTPTKPFYVVDYLRFIVLVLLLCALYKFLKLKIFNLDKRFRSLVKQE